jgi:hypothetical protein
VSSSAEVLIYAAQAAALAIVGLPLCRLAAMLSAIIMVDLHIRRGSFHCVRGWAIASSHHLLLTTLLAVSAPLAGSFAGWAMVAGIPVLATKGFFDILAWFLPWLFHSAFSWNVTGTSANIVRTVCAALLRQLKTAWAAHAAALCSPEPATPARIIVASSYPYSSFKTASPVVPASYHKSALLSGETPDT